MPSQESRSRKSEAVRGANVAVRAPIVGGSIRYPEAQRCSISCRVSSTVPANVNSVEGLTLESLPTGLLMMVDDVASNAPGAPPAGAVEDSHLYVAV